MSCLNYFIEKYPELKELQMSDSYQQEIKEFSALIFLLKFYQVSKVNEVY